MYFSEVSTFYLQYLYLNFFVSNHRIVLTLHFSLLFTCNVSNLEFKLNLLLDPSVE